MTKMTKITRFLFLVLVTVFIFAAGTSVSAENDKVVFGSNYTLHTDQTLDGDLLVLGGNVEIQKDATVTGDAAIFGGNANIQGMIEGSLIVLGGNVNLSSSAEIDGDLSIIGGKVNRSPGAVIGGDSYAKDQITIPNLEMIDNFKDHIKNPGITVSDSSRPRSFIGNLFEMTKSIVFFFAQLLIITLIAFIAALLFEKHVSAGAIGLRRNLFQAFGIGLLSIIAGSIIILFLTITVLFIPLALVIVLMMGLLYFFGWVLIGYESGKKLTALMKVSWSIAATAAFGTFALAFAMNLIAKVVPCVGWIPGFIVSITGLGTAVQYVLKMIQQNPGIKNTLTGKSEVQYGTQIPREGVSYQSSAMERQLHQSAPESGPIHGAPQSYASEMDSSPAAPEVIVVPPAPEPSATDHSAEPEQKSGFGAAFLDSLHEDLKKDSSATESGENNPPAQEN